MNDKRYTAIHEAGHAVAHIRLSLGFGEVTIEPDEESCTLGAACGECASHVGGREDAEKQVMAYLAGIAAVIASGQDRAKAMEGAEEDVVAAEKIIAAWLPGDTVDPWLVRTIAMMQEPPNIKAVGRIAAELLLRTTLPYDAVDFLVEVADGRLTEKEYRKSVVRFYWSTAE